VSNLLSKRFGELLGQMEALVASKKDVYSEYFHKNQPHIDHNALIEWSVKARSLISSACGSQSEHYRTFCENEKTTAYSTHFDTLMRLRAVFLAAKEDFEGG